MASTVSPSSEPVVYQTIAHAIIVALVAVGWLKIDNTTVDVLATAVGAVLAGAATLLTRAHVQPLANLVGAVEAAVPGDVLADGSVAEGHLSAGNEPVAAESAPAEPEPVVPPVAPTAVPQNTDGVSPPAVPTDGTV